MKLFAISDFHLSFNENIDKPMHVFGRGWNNHAERLREAWLSMVSGDDIVLIPGDISWGLKLEEAMDDIEWIHSLPGTKLISKGNHDLWWSKINYLNTLYDDIIFLQNDCYYAEELNTVITATRGWPYPGSAEFSEHDEKMYRREVLRLRMGLDAARSKAPESARIVVALHYPPSDATGIETEYTRVLEEYGVSLCVYGHLHGVSAFETGIKGVHRGVEYRLVSIDYLSAIPREI